MPQYAFNHRLRRFVRDNMNSERLKDRISSLAVILLILLVWETVSRSGIFTEILLPRPSSLVDTTVYLLSSGKLIMHAKASLTRVLIGYTLAAVIAIPIGILMGKNRRLEKSVYPSFEILRPIPPIAWTPLAILWFGIGTMPAIFLIFIGAYFPILINTVDGVKGVERRLVEYAKTLGASERDITLQIIPMAALPSIFTGMRIGLGLAWMVVVAAEMIAANSGLGYMILDARFVLATDVVLVGMITIGVIGLTMDIIFRRIEGMILKWRKGTVVRV